MIPQLIPGPDASFNLDLDAHGRLRSLYVRQCCDTFESWAKAWAGHCRRRGLTAEQAQAHLNEACETCMEETVFNVKCLSAQISCRLAQFKFNFNQTSNFNQKLA